MCEAVEFFIVFGGVVAEVVVFGVSVYGLIFVVLQDHLLDKILVLNRN